MMLGIKKDRELVSLSLIRRSIINLFKYLFKQFYHTPGKKAND